MPKAEPPAPQRRVIGEEAIFGIEDAADVFGKESEGTELLSYFDEVNTLLDVEGFIEREAGAFEHPGVIVERVAGEGDEEEAEQAQEEEGEVLASHVVLVVSREREEMRVMLKAYSSWRSLL